MIQRFVKGVGFGLAALAALLLLGVPLPARAQGQQGTYSYSPGGTGSSGGSGSAAALSNCNALGGILYLSSTSGNGTFTCVVLTGTVQANGASAPTAYGGTAGNRRVCSIVVGDASGSTLTTGQLGATTNQKRLCLIPAAATVLEVDVSADAGTPNVTAARNRAGSQSNLVSSALATASSGGIACSNVGGTVGIDGATTCGSTLQNTSLNAGDYIDLVGGAVSTAKQLVIHVVYTLN